MPFQVTSDNLEVTESMKALADEKLNRVLKKFVDIPQDLIDTRVVLNKGSADDTFEVKVTMNGGGFDLVGNSTDYSVESALIAAVEEVDRQYRKEKDIKDSEEWKERREMKVFQEESQ